MPIHCPSCKQLLSTEGAIPKFCSHCGGSLDGADIVLERNGDTGNGDTGNGDTGNGDTGELTDDGSEVTLPVSRRAARRASASMETQGRGVTEPSGDSGMAAVSIGSFVGPFEIVGLLGQGGMGTVYRATHTETGQAVALKLLTSSVQTSEETIQRFQRESQIAASISHPRSTFVYQAGQHLGQFYITMELMNGGTLTEVVKKEGAIPVGRAIDYILDIISGLQAAHHVGIVHRDLKPSNCFLDHQGRVKVGDFGLAKSLVSDSSLTQTGTFMGTPQFAAPEQLRASEVDERADIYAIGGTLFFLLTGRAPFVGNAAQVIVSIASEVPPKVSTLVANVPKNLTRIVHQILEKDPERRPENLEILRQLLLPYSTRGASTADLGRRMAAFFVDIAIIGFMIGFLTIITSVLMQAIGFKIAGIEFLANIVVSFITSTAYYAIQESWYGTSFGKWLLGMRVITERNQRSSLLPSILRASLVPGLMYITNSIPAYFLDMLNPETFEQIDQGIWVVIKVQLAQLLSWIPVLLCFVTAKKENGYRGIHEFLSGSRVVRLAGSLESNRPQSVPVTSPVGLETPMQFGDFQAIGELGRRPLSKTTVLLGRDVALDRDVWILSRDSSEPTASASASCGVTENRKSVSRPARLRVLAESTDSESAWTVVESVKGMPLLEYVRQTSSIDWRSFRPVLRDLAYELAQSEKDNTIPVQLSRDAVWIDQQGHAKLLDEAMVPLIGSCSTDVSESEESEELNSRPLSDTNGRTITFDLLTQTLDEFIENQVVPAHVLTFRTEMDTLRGEADVLNRIGDRLGELADIPAAWRWDDRLGVLAITVGIELSTAASVGLILVLVCAFFLNMALIPISILSFFVASFVTFSLGAFLGGGLAFRLSGVLVRKNRTLEPASVIRCGFRNWVAWFPITVGMTLMAILVQQAFLASQTRSDLDQSLPVMAVVALIGLIPVSVMTMVGAIYSIVRPSRGLPDVIAGTRLIRK